MPEKLHRIVGTAGHIDHGKTTLVRALTGVETDRLPEEKRRGITIELGFASWAAAPDLDVSVVDVPGHERFVRTMVAGAAGIDLVVLVVSADDGVMPQTREHLAVCELLGVARGLIVLTKADLVDDEMLELVREDVADAVSGTFLQGASVLTCSATTGQGIDEVTAAIIEAVRAHPGREVSGPAFLPVDRVFTKAGFGTVVTGTLLCGELSATADVDVLPGPRGRGLVGLKSRGVQVHNDARAGAHAGMRVAVNLRGSGHEAVSRGDVVVGAGSRESTSALHAEVRVLEDASAIGERDELSFHLGTTDALATVVPLRDGPIQPGETGLLRIVTKTPVVAYAGQRLVLRKPGKHGQGTLAGGRVLDPHPTKGKGSFARWCDISARLAAGDKEARVLALVTDGRSDGVEQTQLIRRSPPGDDALAVVSSLVEAGDVVRIDGAQPRFVDAERVKAVQTEVLERVSGFHEARPLLLGVSPSELATQLSPHERALVEPALKALQATGDVVLEGGVARLVAHDPASGAGAATLAAAEQAWRAAGLTPPLDDEGQQQLGIDAPTLRDGLAELKRRGTLVRLGDLHFHKSALDEVKGRVRTHLQGHSSLTTADLKTLAGGVSRKYAIPLLEWLDAEGVTRREGDARVAGGR